jgi:hypothetical protein
VLAERVHGLLLLGALGGCAGATALAPTATLSTKAAPAAPIVELRGRNAAVVRGQPIAFDGIEEGLAWPALDHAVARKTGDRSPIIMGVARDALMRDLLRAAWTLRNGDLELQTPDGLGDTNVVVFRAKPEGAPGGGCHLAVFVREDGTLRVASASGARGVAGAGADAMARLVRGLDEARRRCPLRYVAFGAETPDARWGPVFDLVLAVDGARAAGDARYVLAEPLRAAGKP